MCKWWWESERKTQLKCIDAFAIASRFEARVRKSAPTEETRFIFAQDKNNKAKKNKQQ